MAFGFRTFLIEDDDSILALPFARFKRVAMQGSEPMTQYSGRRVRYAMVVVEIENRRAEAVIQLEYGYLAFDGRGYIDLLDELRTAAATLELPPPADSRILSAHHRFARKRVREEFQWQPSPALRERLVLAALGRKRKPRFPRSV